jgi:hypothetical protein
VEIDVVTSSIVSHTLSPKSTADVPSMLKILDSSIAAILDKLGTLPSAANDSFLQPVEGGSFYPFEWKTSFNITSGRAVSICTPLARFMAKLIHSASASSLPFSFDSLLPLVPQKMMGLIVACEYAVRNLSFASQVEVELWRRNGLSVVNLIYNYHRSQFAKFFRDMDLTVVQLGILLIGPDTVLEKLASAFECSLIGSERERKLKYSTRALMLSELLRWLILLVTHLPQQTLQSLPSDGESKIDLPFPPDTEGISLSVDRLIAHLLLSGKTSKGKLQTVKETLRCATEIGDEEINASVRRLCLTKQSHTSEPLTLEPKFREVLRLFDPEHPNLPPRDLQIAVDAVRNQRSKPEILSSLLSEVPERPLPHNALPIIFAASLPIPHPAFEAVRGLLLSNSFVALLSTSLSIPSNTELANLTAAKDEAKIPRSTIISIVSRCVHLLTIQLHSTNLREESDSLPSQLNELLPILATIQRSGLLNEDVLYSQGLEWVLREYCWRSPAARQILADNLYEGAVEIERAINHRSEEIKVSAEKEAIKDPILEKRKADARRRAMAAMQKNVTTFAALMEDGPGEEEVTSNGDIPDCVICRFPFHPRAPYPS